MAMWRDREGRKAVAAWLEKQEEQARGETGA